MKEQPALIEIGKAEVRQNFSNSGKPKVAFFALGPMRGIADKAIEELGAENIDAAIINPRFTKPIDGEYLVGAVREALSRDVHVAAIDGERTVEVSGFAQLTPREREVLQLITNGQSNKEAGRLLGISPRTIEVHRARVMEKLGARNTADLMRIVLTS